MIDDIARWPGWVSALVTLIATTLSFLAFAGAAWSGVRAGAEGRPSPAALVHSGWSMSTEQILEQWNHAAPMVMRSVRRSYRCDLVASLLLGVALVIATATVGEEEGLAAIRNTRDWAVRAAVGGTVVALIVDVALLRVVRRYRRTGDVAWLAVSLAMSGVLLRILLIAIATAYVLVASAAT